MTSLFKIPRRYYAFLLALVVLASCKKNIQISEEELMVEEQNFSISFAHDYYSKNLSSNIEKGIGNSLPQAERTFSGKSSIKWNLAKRFQKGGLEMVEAPIRFEKVRLSAYSFDGNSGSQESGLAMLEASFSKIVIYRNGQGKILSRIITFIPDRAYISKYGRDAGDNSVRHIQKAFSGYIEFSALNQKKLFVYRVRPGQSMKKIIIRKNAQKMVGSSINMTSSIAKSAPISPMSSNCGIICDPVYEMTCYEGAPNPEMSNGFDIICNESIVDYNCYDDPSCLPENPGDPDPCNGPFASELPECGFSGDPCADYGICSTPGHPSEPPHYHFPNR